MSSGAGLEGLNSLSPGAAREVLLRCCGSRRWAATVAAGRPFADPDELRAAAREAWDELRDEDRLEAFAAHPEIGGELDGPHPGRDWSRDEQSGMEAAGEKTRAALAAGQRAYRERFGYIFLIRASGRGPEEMLSELRRRLDNDPEAELAAASDQQWQITELRLARLLEAEGSQ